MFRSFTLGVCLGLVLACGAVAQQSTEPPPPRAAPRTSVMAEELPRAGAVVVFGAERPLGREIVKALAAANKQVTAALPPDADRSGFDALKVNVVAADRRAPDQLKEVFTSAPLRAVVMAFDVGDEDSGGALAGARNIIDVTKSTNIPRLVLVSASGAGDSADVLPWYVRLLRGDAIAAAGAAEAHLRSSGLDFTIVRAGWIIEGPPGGTATLDEGIGAFTWIAHGDVARLIAPVVDSRALSGKTATVLDPERANLLSVLF